MTSPNLTAMLASLKATKASEDQGNRDTSHPSAGVDNGTQPTSTGARSSESTADVKKQQAVSVEDAGMPPENKPAAGSQGVEAKESDQSAELDTGDTSGVSEMANMDTTHPSASVDKTADDETAALIKAASDLAAAFSELKDEDAVEAGDAEAAAASVEAEKSAAEKEEEAVAKYASDLESAHPEMVEQGMKFAAEVQQAKLAAECEQLARYGAFRHVLTKHCAGKFAMEEIDAAAAEAAGDPAMDPAAMDAGLAEEAGGMPAGGDEGGVDLSEEELSAILDLLSVEEQGAAAGLGMEDAGVAPEEAAAAGFEVPQEMVGKAASIKISADKAVAFHLLRQHAKGEFAQLKK